MSNPWGGIGAWALEAERAEAEERAHAAASAHQPSPNFPSIKESFTKTKKKKAVSVPLSQFNSTPSNSLTPDELLLLPTGPRERSSDEPPSGFRSYSRRPEFPAKEDRRRPSDPDLPSRSDGVDNWASGKKFAPTADHRRFGSSKADEVDSWASAKRSFAPPRFKLEALKREEGLGDRSRPSPFGAARPREEVLAGKGVDWRKMEMEIEVRRVGGPTSLNSSRPNSANSLKVNPFGDAKPREVLLEEKGMDWRRIDLERERGRVKRSGLLV